MKVFVPIIAVSALLASTVSGWSAGSVTNALEVTITIGQQCKVNPNGNASLDFGFYESLTSASASDIDKATVKEGIGSIQVQCTKDTPYTIALDAGQHPNTSGNVDTRTMVYGANLKNGVGYNLYSDAARTQVWGNSQPSNGTSGNVVAGKADGSLQSYQVFGRIKKPTDSITPGIYKDTVTVSVAF